MYLYLWISNVNMIGILLLIFLNLNQVVACLYCSMNWTAKTKSSIDGKGK